MSYTDMWAHISPTPMDRIVAYRYKHLTLEESGYMDALALAIAHWPKVFQCNYVLTHSHDISGVLSDCHYQFVLNAYNTLHIKEYGE